MTLLADYKHMAVDIHTAESDKERYTACTAVVALLHNMADSAFVGADSSCRFAVDIVAVDTNCSSAAEQCLADSFDVEELKAERLVFD